MAALVVAAVFAFGLWKVFVHSNSLVNPMVVTPKMDVHKTFATDFPARVSRLIREQKHEDRSGRPRLVALTFDDGPYSVATPILLDVLRDLHVRATFFYIGRDAEQWPELTWRTSMEGHELADHTYSHPNLAKLPPAKVAAEIIKGARVLHRYSTDRAIDRLFRPPHGRFTEETLRVAQRLHYLTILWNDDPGDWQTLTARHLADQIESHATAPDVVLLHSGRLPTIAMLPDVIRRFRAAGYTFVTVSELLGRVPAEQANHPSKGAI